PSLEMRRIPASGGPATTISNLASEAGFFMTCAWSSSGEILLATESKRLFLIPENGGTPTPFAPLDGAASDSQRNSPKFLPDGRHFLYVLRPPDSARRSVYVASLDDRKARQLIVDTDSQAEYAEPGYLLFLRRATLYAQPFDAGRLSVSGEPMPL